MDSAVIQKQALQLPEGDRALLADSLLASLTPISSDIEKAWIAEADSRMKALREGKIEAIDGPSAMAKLRSKYSK